MPKTRQESKLAASKQVNTRVDDSTTSSNDSESGVVDRGEQDSLDTQGQMQQNLSEAEQVRGLETDQIHSSDTGSSNEQIGSQQSQNPSQSSFDHSTNSHKNVIMVGKSRRKVKQNGIWKGKKVKQNGIWKGYKWRTSLKLKN
jgi:hypothetical protein